MADYEEISGIVGDPIRTLIENARQIEEADSATFPQKWLLHGLLVELNKYTMEDASIDAQSPVFLAAVEALARLYKDDCWVSPALHDCLVKLRSTALLPPLSYSLERREVRHGDETIHLLERTIADDRLFRVSNSGATHMQVLEDTASSPHDCRALLGAFCREILDLKATLGVSRLCFIQKEMGPVGALSLLSSLVVGTDLPAFIYREDRWASERSLTGELPQSGDHVAIVYDLVVTGAGILGAADLIRRQIGATVVGAVVQCGYGPKRQEIVNEAGRDIELRALDWHEDIHGPVFEYEAIRGKHGASADEAEPREQPGKARVMGSNEDVLGKSIPAGDYDRQTLPPISKGAQQLLDAINDHASKMTARPAVSSSSKYLHLKRRPVSTVRIKRG